MAESGYALETLKSGRERVTNGYRVIDTGHAAIHEGEGFSANVDSTTLAVSSAIYMQINTNSEKYVHFKFYEAGAIDSLFRLSVIEATSNSTFVTGTNSVLFYNKNRTSTQLTDIEIFDDPTLVNYASTNNTLLESVILGSSGSNQARASGGRPLDVEWALKQNSTYIIELLNVGPRTGSGYIYSFWYEEESV